MHKTFFAQRKLPYKNAPSIKNELAGVVGSSTISQPSVEKAPAGSVSARPASSSSNSRLSPFEDKVKGTVRSSQPDMLGLQGDELSYRQKGVEPGETPLERGAREAKGRKVKEEEKEKQGRLPGSFAEGEALGETSGLAVAKGINATGAIVYLTVTAVAW